jgi:microsomal epoxide hydrolase
MTSIPRLTQPERFGGRAEDALDLVIPSLPGYGFSPPHDKIIGPPTFARLFDKLLTEGLGLQSYIAQGGDVGAVISSWMAYKSQACIALHLNYNGWFKAAQKPETPDEEEALRRWHHLRDDDGGYSHLAATRPLNLAYALADSPMGAAAWIFAR